MQNFIDKILPGVKKGYSDYNILPSLTIAQAILESNSGKSQLAIKGNNLFGIKADSRWTGKKINFPTKEFIKGKEITVNTYFRAYGSFSDSVEDHTKFLLTKRYEKVRTSKDYKEACTEIWKAGYATDPRYSQKLIQLIETYRLYEYDAKENTNMNMGTPPVLVTSLERLHPKVKQLALRLLAECSKAGIPVRITQTYRTAQTQQEYYSWGRTKINPFTRDMTKVTNLDGALKPSRHQSGLAFDICINIKGKEYDKELLTKAGQIGIKVGLTWGGSWISFVDMPHFEIPPNKITKFEIPEEDEDMATAKEKGYGKEAIENLHKNGVINSTEHIEDLDGDMPAWKAWVVLNNIYENLKGAK